MALTGKTIGQLTYLSEVTTDTLFPVELSGDTYHLAYSAFTNSNYNTGTYEELYSFATGGTLSAGSFYLMTDYQTCYDQPNFDSGGLAITTGNYKTGPTEPILLLATGPSSFSPTVYSTIYPQDKISYDINFTQTEITNSPAKGRITERIDQSNNRTDYDSREVKFIRYQGFFSENLYNGKITLDGYGNVVGVGTNFLSQFTVGDILGVYDLNINFISCFNYYEIVSIADDFNMVVTGNFISGINDTYYSNGQPLPNYMNPFQCNIPSLSGSAEYYTFSDAGNGAWNTYIGDNNLINENFPFILSNNVFLGGAYRDNYFGGNCIGNTFNDDCDSNTFGDKFQFNIITNDFDENTIGPDFQRNIIDTDFRRNSILEGFRNNMIGDEDGDEFEDNIIGNGFGENFITITDPFSNNNIGNVFYRNIINNRFIKNQISYNFQNNLITGDFDENQIGNFFINNSIVSNIRKNVFGVDCYDNILGTNNINGSIERNRIGDSFNNNTILPSFFDNQIGNNFNNNGVFMITTLNTIGNNSQFNTIGISGDTSNLFTNNIILNQFADNGFSGDTRYNTIGSEFIDNNIDHNFAYNKIGNFFRNNTIANDFGFGGGNARGNTIGNFFEYNTIGEYFYDNQVSDLFGYNTTGDYFQLNNISAYSLSGVDFTVNYGNINTISYVATGTTATDGVYTGIIPTFQQYGIGATFNITVSGGQVTEIVIDQSGKLYQTGESILIDASSISGSGESISVTVDSVSATPVVYTSTNANIVKNSSGQNKLYYLGGSGIEFVDITSPFD